eukprot:PhM_4_TR9497/c0_g1_i2/m.25937
MSQHHQYYYPLFDTVRQLMDGLDANMNVTASNSFTKDILLRETVDEMKARHRREEKIVEEFEMRYLAASNKEDGASSAIDTVLSRSLLCAPVMSSADFRSKQAEYVGEIYHGERTLRRDFGPPKSNNSNKDVNDQNHEVLRRKGKRPKSVDDDDGNS